MDTKQAEEIYEGQDSHRCPFCQSENIKGVMKPDSYGHRLAVTGKSMMHSWVHCNECGKEIIDRYGQETKKALITSFKGRKLNYEHPVRVYRNLNRQQGTKKYSIRQNGLVVGHADVLTMVRCKFIVSQSGRERVLREKKKNVHAFIEGMITLKGCMGTSAELEKPLNCKITYNPYEFEQFVCKGLVNRTLIVKGGMGILINSHGITGSYLDFEEIANYEYAKRMKNQ